MSKDPYEELALKIYDCYDLEDIKLFFISQYAQILSENKDLYDELKETYEDQNE